MVGGVEVKQGQRAMLFMVAANRDPKVFEDPQEFDLERSPNKHIAFGFGRHFCVGAMLARIEGRVAFEQILTRFPVLTLAKPTAWSSNPSFRCLTELQLKR